MSLIEAEPQERVLPAITSLGGAIDDLFKLREEKRKLEAEVKKVEAKYSLLEEALMETLNKQGLDKASGKSATASVTSSVVAQVEDWDAVNKFIKRTGYFHLYIRRLNDSAVRELFESKGAVPGVVPFTKRKLSLRVI